MAWRFRGFESRGGACTSLGLGFYWVAVEELNLNHYNKEMVWLK